MKQHLFLSLTLGTGWLLCPESLVMVGNGAGQMGWIALPLLVAIALLYSICNKLIQTPRFPDTTGGGFLLLKTMTGAIPAAGISLAAFIPLLILAATALLVTSGYTFNEVFLYWFPNFGFSFLLLALLCTLQLLPEKLIVRAQIFFVCLAAGGLLILSVYGITTSDIPTTAVLKESGSIWSSSSAILLLLFAGLTCNSNTQHSFFSVPVAGLLIFSLWIVASLTYVSPERLTSSTIPYMTAARKIMGEPGRQLMGIIVISGTCAAITGLMLLCKQMLCNIAGVNSPNSKFSRNLRWSFSPLIAMITGILLATGLAGDELLEVLLRGALILWLAHYTLLCFAAILHSYRKAKTVPWTGSVCTCVLMVALFSLITDNPHRMELLVFLFSVLIISGLFSTIWFYINTIHPNKHLTNGENR